ncbi:MAG TPA: acyl-CoA thioesterase, partial [Nitrosopumilaceae archaeon]|nr:acyl-CoA thioesterase [Nitrosopumilaceae archaeon]
RTPTGTAFVTAVALDKEGRPTPVPELMLETDEDKRKFAEGKARMEQRARERKMAKESGEHG